MQIRPMTEMDLDAVTHVEEVCFSDAWSRKNFEDSLKEPSAHLLVTVDEASDEVIGYCCLYQALDEGEIVNVAIAPGYRQKGYGAAMVEALMKLGRSLGAESFYLEVRAGNTAGKRLYESIGFETCGIRKDFYSDPREDAVLMVWQGKSICQ